jgi:arsenate reductase
LSCRDMRRDLVPDELHVAGLETTVRRHRSAAATMLGVHTRAKRGFALVASRWPQLFAEADMKATIYHNPKCGTSRKTLEILRDSGADVWIHEYLQNPPTREQLQQLYRSAGITPREGLRAKEPLAVELGLTRPGATDDEVLDAMVKHPILIERPLVETSKGVRLCRPQEVVREIL